MGYIHGLLRETRRTLGGGKFRLTYREWFPQRVSRYEKPKKIGAWGQKVFDLNRFEKSWEISVNFFYVQVLTGREHVSSPQPVEQTERDEEYHLNEHTYSPLSEQLLGVYDFKEDVKRQVIQNETCDVDDLRKKIREPAVS